MVGYYPCRITNFTEEWYSEFQDEYESPIEQKAQTSQAYQQESQLPAESEKKESKWDLKIDNYDEESRGYYQEHRANYGNPQMKQRFRRITRWREHRAERLDRRMGLKIQHHGILLGSQTENS